jgi:hypothetical protein
MQLESWEKFAAAALGGVVSDPDSQGAEAAADFAADCADHMLRRWLERAARVVKGNGPLPENE